MKGLPLSRAASGLLRALLLRLDGQAHRILLTEVQSTDWQSLTFTGERHKVALRVTGECPEVIAHQLTGGIADAEFRIPGQIVADIGVGQWIQCDDGSVLVTIEALTISE